MTDWLRLWHDMPTDPKWRVIARKSGKPLPCVIALYTLLLTTASAADDRGSISGLTIEDAAAALDMDEDDVAAIYQAMDGRVIDSARLSGWERRQPKRERENDDSSQRVKAHREKVKRAVSNDVTPCNAMQRHETPREEESREETDITPLTPLGGSERDYAFRGRVARLNQKDFDELRKRFHAISDFVAELTAFDGWVTDQPAAKQAKWFGSLAPWLNRRHQEALERAKSQERDWVFSSPT